MCTGIYNYQVAQLNSKDLALSAQLQVERFIRLHGKRWQATIILLCDSLSISPHLLNEDRLQFIRQLGEFFEFEGTVSHDLSR